MIDIKYVKKKVEFEIEPFEWIEPNLIRGYKIEQVRNFNIYSFFEKDEDENNLIEADKIIADYYLECDSRDPNIYLLLKYGIWLIKNLYCSYVSYIYPSFMRSRITKYNVEEIFDILYANFEDSFIHDEKHSANLIKVFLFDLIGYGPEWGVFVNKQSKNSVSQVNMVIPEIPNEEILCSFLSKNRLFGLVRLEVFSENYPLNYKY
ncbi:hypothetical protein [Ornithobacterium rhinotracheale]|uniref:hypothetical protein n=1 Tax=Ornithobacterium rhinotracheale TaxID=28251 RepID=UPI001FB91CB8|nr:hypothetical protein [Ornithobacterium rhinotracheale]UOH64933.1 hypothetical protein MT999_06905 [Ornithobacterium rhinotracheale]